MVQITINLGGGEVYRYGGSVKPVSGNEGWRDGKTIDGAFDAPKQIAAEQPRKSSRPADVLQRLNFSLDEELLYGDGLWPRDRLLAMDASYTTAVERAFELDLESRAAAAATVSFRNGKAAAIEGAIEAAWDRLCSKKGEMSAAEVLVFVRELCPNTNPAYVRAALEQRVRRGVKW